MWPLLSLALASDPTLHSHPDLHQATLPNGLTWYARQVPGEDVHVRLVIGAGSVHETDDQRGAAHLLRHLLSRPGLTAPVDDDPGRAWTQTELDLLRAPDGLDAALAALAAPVDFTSCDAALAEVNAEPRYDTTYATLLRGPRYASHPPAGPAPDLTCDAARAFVDRWYRPRAMAVIVVGDLAPDVAESAIARAFGDLPDRGGRPAPIVPIPRSAAARAVDLPADAQPLLVIKFPAWLRPVRSTADLRRRDADEAAEIALWSRLGSLSVPGEAAPDGRIWLSPLPGHGFEELSAELHRLLRDGFSDAEAEEARAVQHRRLDPERGPPLSDRWLDACADAFRGDPTAILTKAGLTNRSTPIDLSAHDLTRALRQGPLAQDGRFIAVGTPAGTARRAVPDLVRHTEIPPIPTAPLISPRPAPTATGPRTFDPASSTTSWTLPNGARVVLFPSATTRGEVQFLALTHASADPDLSRNVGSIVRDSGVANDSPLDLYRRNIGAPAEVRVEMDATHSYATGSGDLAAALELLYARFTAQRFSDDAATEVRETYRAYAAHFTDADRFAAAWFAGDLRGAPPLTDDALARLTAPNFEAVYRDVFARANGFVFAFSGDITPDALEPLLAQWIAPLPSGPAAQPAPAPTPPVAADQTLRGGDHTHLGLRWEVAGQPSSADYYALDTITTLLTDRLHERLAGEVGPGDLWADSGWRSTTALLVELECDPARLPQLEARVREEVAAFARAEVSAEALSAALPSRSWQQGDISNATLASRLAEALLDGRPLADAVHPGPPQPITPATIQALTQRLLTDGVLTRVVMTP